MREAEEYAYGVNERQVMVTEERALDPETLPELTFGEVLRSLRRRKGWSIPRLSAETEIDVAYLSRLENGKKDNPTGPLLACIADALGLDGAERFFFFSKALEAKYGSTYVFGGRPRDETDRVFAAIASVFDYGRRLVGLLPRKLRKLTRRPFSS